MLTRIAASVVSLALASSAGARSFSQPPAPHAIRLADQLPDRAAVRAALAARRAHNLASFRAYRERGIYPHNFDRPGPLNTWRDRDGHLCAAATMLDMDGQHALVLDTARTNDHIRLLDVVDGPLLDWMLASGFTIEEIDQIQFPGFNERMSRDPDLRRAELADEDVKLRRHYIETERQLVANERAGLDLAVDRLMARPELARRLLAERAAATPAAS